MKIESITYQSTQRTTNSSKITRRYRIPFTQSQDNINLSPDNKQYIKVIDKFYTKINKDLDIISPNEIETSVKNISRNTGIDKDQLYPILQQLTTYSSYNSIKELNNNFKRNHIASISNLNYIIEEKEHEELLRTEQKNKQFSGYEFPWKTRRRVGQDILIKDTPLMMNNVLSYILSRNTNVGVGSGYNKCNKHIIIFDSRLIDYLANLPSEKREAFDRTYFKDIKTIPVFIENFERGYNFLNCAKAFENYATEIINKAQLLPDSKGSLKEKVDYIVNGELIERMKEIGIEPFIISTTTSPNEINSSTIAKNLNPIVPEKPEVIRIIDKCTKSRKDNSLEAKKYIIKFLDKTFLPISPKEYAVGMQSLHSKINEFINMNQKDPKNVFFIIPALDKSFAPATYIYQQLNNISEPKNLLINNNSIHANLLNLKLFPQNTTFIVLDDCMISGMSLGKTVFPYYKFAECKDNREKDISIIIASLTGTEIGMNNINEVIKMYGRQNKDKVIVEKIIPSWHYPSTEDDAEYLDEINDNKYLTSLVLPYMGPDTNCSALVPFYEKFFINRKAQKVVVDNLDFYSIF